MGSSGTEPTGGFEWRLWAARVGGCAGLMCGSSRQILEGDLSPFPVRNPERLYSEPRLLLLLPLRFLKHLQWPLGRQSLDMEEECA